MMECRWLSTSRFFNVELDAFCDRLFATVERTAVKGLTSSAFSARFRNSERWRSRGWARGKRGQETVLVYGPSLWCFSPWLLHPLHPCRSPRRLLRQRHQQLHHPRYRSRNHWRFRSRSRFRCHRCRCSHHRFRRHHPRCPWTSYCSQRRASAPLPASRARWTDPLPGKGSTCDSSRFGECGEDECKYTFSIAIVSILV